MINSAFSGIAQAVLILALSYFYILIITRFLPGKWLRPIFPANKHDRGTKKNTFENGRSVTFEPRLALRRYMSEYVLYCDREKKYIKCKISEDIKEINYSVTIFGRNDRVIGTLDISEKTRGNGYTQAVNLPDETAFVQINILYADGKYLEKNVTTYYNSKGIISYAVASIFCTVVMALLYIIAIHDFMNYFISDYYYYMEGLPNLAVALLFGVCFGAVNTGIMILLNVKGNVKTVTPESGKK